MSQAQVEVATGRMGDALIKCGKEKAALAEWARGIQGDLAGDPEQVSRRVDPIPSGLVVIESGRVVSGDDRGPSKMAMMPGKRKLKECKNGG